MKVAIYARVSTSGNGQDPTMQTSHNADARAAGVHRAPRLGARRANTSTSASRRLELDRLMADGTVDALTVVAVWKFDHTVPGCPNRDVPAFFRLRSVTSELS
jgi:DNA invertase Pin-like site-specific DNA recombinase